MDPNHAAAAASAGASGDERSELKMLDLLGLRRGVRWHCRQRGYRPGVVFFSPKKGEAMLGFA